MTATFPLRAGALALALGLALAPFGGRAATPSTAQEYAALVRANAAGVSMSVFATGLNNPRGLKFGPDGRMYVAEGGVGGTQSTVGLCDQAPGVGPYTGSPTGSRISRISPQGVRTTVSKPLPSSQTNPELGSLVSGVADIAFLHGRMYALIAGAGCSHGIPTRDNAVVRIASDGTPVLVANLSVFLKTHPVQNPNLGDFEPDGTWWNLTAAGDNLYATEPNHGELDRISPTGEVRRVVDISASQGHIVPTALAAFYGNFFVGNLGTFPVIAGSEKIMKISPAGNITTAVSGLTAVLAIRFDDLGRMYVLQTTDGSMPTPVPGTGSIVRVANGTKTTIVSGLTTPTAMVFGASGDLYVTNVGFGAPPNGLGQILRIHLGK
jgi:sugar lactone lactonase YvrE